MRHYFGISLLACILIASPAWATEKISAEDLVIQAKIHYLPQAMGFAFGSLWALTTCGSTLVRVEASTNKVTEIIVHRVDTPEAMTMGEGAIWIFDARKKIIFRIDPNNLSVTGEIRIPNLTEVVDIGVGMGTVWVITGDDFDKTLMRFNARSGVAEGQISLPSGASRIVVKDDSVWVTARARNELYKIDPQTHSINTTVLRQIPGALAAGEGSIWVLNQGDSSVQRIDARTGKILATIFTDLPPAFGHITSGGGFVWVSMQGAPLVQIDPITNTLKRGFIGGHGIGGFVSYGASSLWIGGNRIARFLPPTD